MIDLDGLLRDNGCWGVNHRLSIPFINDKSVQWNGQRKVQYLIMNQTVPSGYNNGQPMGLTLGVWITETVGVRGNSPREPSGTPSVFLCLLEQLGVVLWPVLATSKSVCYNSNWFLDVTAVDIQVYSGWLSPQCREVCNFPEHQFVKGAIGFHFLNAHSGARKPCSLWRKISINHGLYWKSSDKFRKVNTCKCLFGFLGLNAKAGDTYSQGTSLE